MAQAKKKSPAEMLGLERMPKLTIKACEARAKELRSKIDRGVFKKAEMVQLARRWANWYKTKANSLRGQNKPATLKKKPAPKRSKEVPAMVPPTPGPGITELAEQLSGMTEEE